MDISIHIDQDETQFINACVAQKEWAQKALYERYYSQLYPLCLRYARDEEEALDFLHDGFIKVFRTIGNYNIGTNLTAWIKRVVVNCSIDNYRKRARRSTSNLDECYGIANDSVDALELMSAAEIISCIQHLPPKYKLVFNMFVVEGYSHGDIAQKLNINESTSRSNLVKARHRLKQIIKSKGIIYERQAI